MFNLLKYEVTSRWKGILGWGIGLTLFGTMYITVFPEVSEQMEALADLSIYQAMGIDLASFAGYIASVVVQYVPLLLAIYVAIASTGTLAGEEDQGTLELVLTAPIHRWQILTVKAIAILLATLLIITIAGFGDAIVLAIIKNTVEVDVTPGQLFVAVLNSMPITTTFIMMGLFLGAYLPNRRVAVTVLAIVIIASYFAKVLFGLVESLDALKPISLFHFFDTSTAVFNEGVQASDVLVLLIVAGVFFVLALLSFQRRDVTVGKWPWQRSGAPA